MSDNLNNNDIVRYETYLRNPSFILGTDGSVTNAYGRPQPLYENYSGYLEFVFKEYRDDRSRKSVHVQIHRAMALQFIKNDLWETHKIVNHRDKNKHNNAVINLEWCTPSQNSAWSKDDQVRGTLRFNKYSYELVDGVARMFVCTYVMAKVAHQETGISFDSLNHAEDGHIFIVFPSEDREGFLLEKTGSRVRSRTEKFENRLRELPDGFVQHVNFPEYAVKDGGRLMRISSKEEYFPKARGTAKPRVGLYVLNPDTDKSERTSICLNKLIALQFIPIPERLRDYDMVDLRVISRNGNRFDFNSSNLEWATKNETGAYISRQNIYQYDLDDNLVGEFISKTSASNKSGVSVKKIRRILKNGKVKLGDKFMWRYRNIERKSDEFAPIACSSTDPVDVNNDLVIDHPVRMFSVEERILPYIPSYPPVFPESVRKGNICICTDRWEVLSTQPSATKIATWMGRSEGIHGVSTKLIIDACEGRISNVRGYKMKYVDDTDLAKVYDSKYNDDNPATWKRYTYNRNLVVSQFGHVFSLVDMRLEYPNEDNIYVLEGSDERFTPEQLADSVYHSSIVKYPHHWKIVRPKPEGRDVVVSLRGIVYISVNENGGYMLLDRDPAVRKVVVNINKKRHEANKLVMLAWKMNMISD